MLHVARTSAVKSQRRRSGGFGVVFSWGTALLRPLESYLPGPHGKQKRGEPGGGGTKHQAVKVNRYLPLIIPRTPRRRIPLPAHSQRRAP